MALDPRVRKQINDEVFGRSDYEPKVTFYDHAAFSDTLTAESGRPRFVEQTYIMLKPTHPDLKVRDVVSHAAKPEEIAYYTKEWAEYLQRKKEQQEFKPPLQAIPGMRISYFRELQELGIFDAEALSEYEGDLGEISHLRDLSRKIMEISREARDLYAKRQEVRDVQDRPEHRVPPVPGAGPQEVTVQKESPAQTFSYQVSL